jgi:hypothetical protein
MKHHLEPSLKTTFRRKSIAKQTARVYALGTLPAVLPRKFRRNC